MMKKMTDKQEAEIDNELLKAKFYKKHFEQLSYFLDIAQFDEVVIGIIRFAWKYYQKGLAEGLKRS
jgi:hypothetical protein